MSTLCLDCQTLATGPAPRRCRSCGSPRLRTHAELETLTIAHMDCDAFYAAVEKRDNPDLRDKPVIIGGGKRGVVSTACYVARTFGVKSAMPMFQALKACPQAVVVRPDMRKYAAVSRQVRALMEALTPAIEPLSMDEAFLDLSGTERLHGQCAAVSLAKLAARIAREIGITVSIGLAPNKFLAKIASDLDKPRGFAVIGAAEAAAFLASKPVTLIHGIGKASAASFAAQGVTSIGQLQRMDDAELLRRFGSHGLRLGRLSRGLDNRQVRPHGETKGISSETTFFDDISDFAELDPLLWRQCERVSARAKKQGYGGRTITLKLKTANFRLRTRSTTRDTPTQLAENIYQASRPLLKAECDGTSFRLMGVGISHLEPEERCDPPDLLDKSSGRKAAAERAIDAVRARFGADAIGKGRGRR
ncbi:MAG TPA: DNA polymerase IV [Micropepsaceae bacterium]|nr:DNA polymerase IV [Micropepsaceae bacterium]